jgi:integrase
MAKRDLPKCLHTKHGAYYLVRANKWEFLSRNRAAALRMYDEKMRPPSNAIEQLLRDAIAARPRLRSSTRKQYETAVRHIAHGLQQFQPHEILPRHVAEFKATLADTPNMANRCLSVLRLAMDYALERGEIDRNPAIGIPRFREVRRPRLLSPTEYRAIYDQAGPRLQCIMDLCYLTGQRITDVLTIRRSQLRDGGIEFVQQKTGARLLVRAPGLAEVIERAKGLHGAVQPLTLFRSRRGGPPHYRTVRDQWEAACEAAGVEDAHIHDLRAMSLTHARAQGLNATALAGHTTEAMTVRYLRSKETPEVQGPDLSKIAAMRS